MQNVHAEIKAIEQLLAAKKGLAAIKALNAVQKAHPPMQRGVPEWRLQEMYAEASRLTLDPVQLVNALYDAACFDRDLRRQREHFSAHLFAAHYAFNLGPYGLAKRHLNYSVLYEEQETLPARPLLPHTRLRIGYLAPNFCDGSAARFYEAALTTLPADEFDVTLYAMEDKEDAFPAQLQQRYAYKCLQHETLQGAAEVIRDDEIDILFDLGGHTEGGLTLMVMGYHPAPVQLCGIGWFDTTGLPAVDGLLTDTLLDPPNSTYLEWYTEHLCYLPGTSLCFTPNAAMQAMHDELLATWPQHEPRPDRRGTGELWTLGGEQPEPGEGVVFGCFQNFLKINQQVLDCWSLILRLVPSARLVIQDTVASEARVARMRNLCAAALIPSHRVQVRPGRPEYLQDYAEIDVMLDTFPYPGGAMTATALYLGRPVVSMRGGHHSARFGAAIQQAAGHEEWLAMDEAGYISRAVSLAAQADQLPQLQRQLLAEVPQSPLMNSQLYGQRLALLYSELWSAKRAFGNIEKAANPN